MAIAFFRNDNDYEIIVPGYDADVKVPRKGVISGNYYLNLYQKIGLTRLDDDAGLEVVYNYEIPPEVYVGGGVENTLSYWTSPDTLGSVPTTAYEEGILTIEDFGVTSGFIESVMFKEGENYDVGLERSGTKTLKVTDGTTGYGKLLLEQLLFSRTNEATPEGVNHPGVKGELRITDYGIFFCIDTNTWRVIPFTTDFPPA